MPSRYDSPTNFDSPYGHRKHTVTVQIERWIFVLVMICINTSTAATYYDICYHSILNFNTVGMEGYITSSSYPNTQSREDFLKGKCVLFIGMCQNCRIEMTIAMEMPNCAEQQGSSDICIDGCNGLTVFNAETVDQFSHYYGWQEHVMFTISKRHAIVFCRSQYIPGVRFRVHFIVKGNSTMRFTTTTTTSISGSSTPKKLISLVSIPCVIVIMVAALCGYHYRRLLLRRRQRQEQPVAEFSQRVITVSQTGGNQSAIQTRNDLSGMHEAPPSYQECIGIYPNETSPSWGDSWLQRLQVVHLKPAPPSYEAATIWTSTNSVGPAPRNRDDTSGSQEQGDTVGSRANTQESTDI